MNGFQFFVHNDPDAVRVELAGSLRAVDVATVYRAWQRAALTDALKPSIVDITFITDADERGRALLAIMHRSGTRIIAQSPESSALARPIVSEPIETVSSKPGWFHGLFHRLLVFLELRPAGATLPAQAEIIDPDSARRWRGSIAYKALADLEVLEDAVRYPKTEVARCLG